MCCSEIEFQRLILEIDLNARETVQSRWSGQHDLVENTEITKLPNKANNKGDGEKITLLSAPSVPNDENEADVLPSSEVLSNEGKSIGFDFF